MVFIDWISPAEHASFNDSLFSALNLSGRKLFVFSKKLKLERQENTVTCCSGGRFNRALKVYKICWKYRKDPIFFLSYDSLLIIFLQVFCKKLYVYEHNTTPEGKVFWKHACWQKLFFLKIVRFAQFLSQHETLLNLGQNSVFLGSPLRKEKIVKQACDTREIFLAPSDRLQKSELRKIKNLVGDSEIIIRKSFFSDAQLEEIKKDININPQAWIDLEYCLPKTKAIIIAISSNTRGSGWFNESIKYGIPLIVTSDNVQKIFENTFPGYPYIRLNEMRSEMHLESEIAKLSKYSNEEYIGLHNKKLKDVFFATIDGIIN